MRRAQKDKSEWSSFTVASVHKEQKFELFIKRLKNKNLFLKLCLFPRKIPGYPKQYPIFATKTQTKAHKLSTEQQIQKQQFRQKTDKLNSLEVAKNFKLDI